MNALASITMPARHIEYVDEAIEDLQNAIAYLRIARASVTAQHVRGALKFASSNIECAQLVIAGAVEGCK